METVNMNKFKWEERKRKMKENVRQKTEHAARWAYNNKELLVAVVPIATATIHGATKIISNAQKSQNLKKEEEARRLNIYDPSRGMYCRLRRPLTSDEQIRLDDLRSHGYSVTKALDMMEMLK